MYFLRKIIFYFPLKEKISYFPGKKTPSFQIIQQARSNSSAAFFGKTIFPEHLEKEN